MVLQSLHISKLDYECVAYCAASQSVLKKFVTLMNSSMRICLGAFPPSPATSLTCEAGLPPFLYRQREQIVSYVSDILASAIHPLYSLFYNRV